MRIRVPNHSKRLHQRSEKSNAGQVTSQRTDLIMNNLTELASWPRSLIDYVTSSWRLLGHKMAHNARLAPCGPVNGPIQIQRFVIKNSCIAFVFRNESSSTDRNSKNYVESAAIYELLTWFGSHRGAAALGTLRQKYIRREDGFGR